MNLIHLHGCVDFCRCVRSAVLIKGMVEWQGGAAHKQWSAARLAVVAHAFEEGARISESNDLVPIQSELRVTTGCLCAITLPLTLAVFYILLQL